MWLEIELDFFNVQHHGFVENKSSNNILYVSPGFEHLQSARDLIQNERGIAIEININKQKITFGRDYLDRKSVV